MSHQSSLLSSNTAGYDWPDFSSFSNLHPNALMCVHKLVRVGVMEDEEGISSVSCLLCFPCCLVLHRGHFKIVPSAWRMLSPIVCGFEGRCWESRSSCSHHSGQFSWINRDLLTRKHKQVDWSESGHENIYCCRWNAENAAVLNIIMPPWHQPLILSPSSSSSSSFWACYEWFENMGWKLLWRQTQ